MDKLYVGNDGIIRSVPNENSQKGINIDLDTGRVEREDLNFDIGETDVSLGRKIFYWVISLALGAAALWGVYSVGGEKLVSVIMDGSHYMALRGFMADISGYAFLIGGIGGSVIYGTVFAKRRYYDLAAVILAVISVAAGGAAFGVLVYVVLILIMGIIELLKIIVLIAVALGVIFGLIDS